MGDPKWINRWNSWIAPRPSKPGVWRRRDGGFVVRARALDPRTNKMREVRLTLPEATADDAYERLQAELKRVRTGAPEPTTQSPPLWCDYAVSLLERKMNDGSVKAHHSKAVWASAFRTHLVPAFGRFRIDQIRRADVLAWRDKFALRIKRGEISPVTANNQLRLFALVMNSAFDEYEFEGRSPAHKMAFFDTSEHATYTEEEPNSLTVQELTRFLGVMRDRHPQYYAMTVLGFTLGLRPSSLRPLRRNGETPDLRLDEGLLFIRRSHTGGDEEDVMNTTKTKRRLTIPLPKELVEVLRWHIARLPFGPMADSELLFPSSTGGYMSTSSLQKPFASVSCFMGLRKNITPRAMRRTFQDVARAANLHDLVTRAVSGHATPEMHRHYSTVSGDEIREGLGRVVSLAGFRLLETEPSGPGGMHGGMHAGETKKAG